MLKTVEFKRTEEETNIEFPVYLYHQDEMGNDELQKIDADKEITLRSLYEGYRKGYEIFVSKSDGCIQKHHLKSITTKKHYDEFYAEVIEFISKIEL
jgi:Ca2+-binding EF-hand superfamily protein